MWVFSKVEKEPEVLLEKLIRYPLGMVPKPIVKATVVLRDVYMETNSIAGLSTQRCGKYAESKGKKGTSGVT